MKPIDFDGMFDKKLARYLKENAGKYTEKEWDKLIESFDETEDDIRRQLQEAREQQRKDREKSKEI